LPSSSRRALASDFVLDQVEHWVQLGTHKETVAPVLHRTAYVRMRISALCDTTAARSRNRPQDETAPEIAGLSS
jgi:hypothetical protein